MAEYYYADPTTKEFLFKSDRTLWDTDYILVTTAPPSGTAVLNTQNQWVDTSEPVTLDNIEKATTEEAIALLVAELKSPQTSTRDIQQVIATSEEVYDKTSWAIIPGMQLTSQNQERSQYQISAELLLKVSKNNRDFEVAIFIDDQQQYEDTLAIDFARNNDDKPIKWSNIYFLDPNSTVTLRWRRIGGSVNCYVGRRKLLLEETANFVHKYVVVGGEIEEEEEDDDD